MRLILFYLLFILSLIGFDRVVGTTIYGLYPDSIYYTQPNSANDPRLFTYGIVFTTTVPGYVLGPKSFWFDDDVVTTTPHSTSLWSIVPGSTSGNVLLATTTYEPHNQWMNVTFDTPIRIVVGTTYILCIRHLGGSLAISSTPTPNVFVQTRALQYVTSVMITGGVDPVSNAPGCYQNNPQLYCFQNEYGYMLDVMFTVDALTVIVPGRVTVPTGDSSSLPRITRLNSLRYIRQGNNWMPNSCNHPCWTGLMCDIPSVRVPIPVTKEYFYVWGNSDPPNTPLPWPYIVYSHGFNINLAEWISNSTENQFPIYFPIFNDVIYIQQLTTYKGIPIDISLRNPDVPVCWVDSVVPDVDPKPVSMWLGPGVCDATVLCDTSRTTPIGQCYTPGDGSTPSYGDYSCVLADVNAACTPSGCSCSDPCWTGPLCTAPAQRQPLPVKPLYEFEVLTRSGWVVSPFPYRVQFDSSIFPWDAAFSTFTPSPDSQFSVGISFFDDPTNFAVLQRVTILPDNGPVDFNRIGAFRYNGNIIGSTNIRLPKLNGVCYVDVDPFYNSTIVPTEIPTGGINPPCAAFGTVGCGKDRHCVRQTGSEWQWTTISSDLSETVTMLNPQPLNIAPLANAYLKPSYTNNPYTSTDICCPRGYIGNDCKTKIGCCQAWSPTTGLCRSTSNTGCDQGSICLTQDQYGVPVLAADTRCLACPHNTTGTFCEKQAPPMYTNDTITQVVGRRLLETSSITLVNSGVTSKKVPRQLSRACDCSVRWSNNDTRIVTRKRMQIFGSDPQQNLLSYATPNPLTTVSVQDNRYVRSAEQARFLCYHDFACDGFFLRAAPSPNQNLSLATFFNSKSSSWGGNAITTPIGSVIWSINRTHVGSFSSCPDSTFNATYYSLRYPAVLPIGSSAADWERHFRLWGHSAHFSPNANCKLDSSYYEDQQGCSVLLPFVPVIWPATNITNAVCGNISQIQSSRLDKPNGLDGKVIGTSIVSNSQNQCSCKTPFTSTDPNSPTDCGSDMCWAGRVNTTWVNSTNTDLSLACICDGIRSTDPLKCDGQRCDWCKASPCDSQTITTLSSDGNSCNCHHLFTGPLCETSLCDPNNTNPFDYSQLIDGKLPINVVCDCKPGWEQPYCNETCIFGDWNEAARTCTCLDGYVKATNQTGVCEPACGPNGHWNTDNGGYCKCQSSIWYGPKCQFHSCNDNPISQSIGWTSTLPFGEPTQDIYGEWKCACNYPYRSSAVDLNPINCAASFCGFGSPRPDSTPNTPIINRCQCDETYHDIGVRTDENHCTNTSCSNPCGIGDCKVGTTFGDPVQLDRAVGGGPCCLCPAIASHFINASCNAFCSYYDECKTNDHSTFSYNPTSNTYTCQCIHGWKNFNEAEHDCSVPNPDAPNINHNITTPQVINPFGDPPPDIPVDTGSSSSSASISNTLLYALGGSAGGLLLLTSLFQYASKSLLTSAGTKVITDETASMLAKPKNGPSIASSSTGGRHVKLISRLALIMIIAMVSVQCVESAAAPIGDLHQDNCVDTNDISTCQPTFRGNNAWNWNTGTFGFYGDVHIADDFTSQSWTSNYIPNIPAYMGFSTGYSTNAFVDPRVCRVGVGREAGCRKDWSGVYYSGSGSISIGNVSHIDPSLVFIGTVSVNVPDAATLFGGEPYHVLPYVGLCIQHDTIFSDGKSRGVCLNGGICKFGSSVAHLISGNHGGARLNNVVNIDTFTSLPLTLDTLMDGFTLNEQTTKTSGNTISILHRDRYAVTGCQCPNGFFGLYCESECPSYDNTSKGRGLCSGHGICQTAVNSRITWDDYSTCRCGTPAEIGGKDTGCLCDVGYTGPSCEFAVRTDLMNKHNIKGDYSTSIETKPWYEFHSEPILGTSTCCPWNHPDCDSLYDQYTPKTCMGGGLTSCDVVGDTATFKGVHFYEHINHNECGEDDETSGSAGIEGVPNWLYWRKAGAYGWNSAGEPVGRGVCWGGHDSTKNSVPKTKSMCWCNPPYIKPGNSKWPTSPAYSVLPRHGWWGPHCQFRTCTSLDLPSDITNDQTAVSSIMTVTPSDDPLLQCSGHYTRSLVDGDAFPADPQSICDDYSDPVAIQNNDWSSVNTKGKCRECEDGWGAFRGVSAQQLVGTKLEQYGNGLCQEQTLHSKGGSPCGGYAFVNFGATITTGSTAVPPKPDKTIVLIDSCTCPLYGVNHNDSTALCQRSCTKGLINQTVNFRDTSGHETNIKMLDFTPTACGGIKQGTCRPIADSNKLFPDGYNSACLCQAGWIGFDCQTRDTTMFEDDVKSDPLEQVCGPVGQYINKVDDGTWTNKQGHNIADEDYFYSIVALMTPTQLNTLTTASMYAVHQCQCSPDKRDRKWTTDHTVDGSGKQTCFRGCDAVELNGYDNNGVMSSCSGNGTCVAVPKNYAAAGSETKYDRMCKCKPGYTGMACQNIHLRDGPNMNGNICGVGGEAALKYNADNGVDQYCDCPKTIQSPINPKRTLDVWTHNTTTTASPGVCYTKCPMGVAWDGAQSLVCGGYGQCVTNTADNNNEICKCQDGWAGDNCIIRLMPAYKAQSGNEITCSGQGILDPANAGFCLCNEGFVGEACEIFTGNRQCNAGQSFLDTDSNGFIIV